MTGADDDLLMRATEQSRLVRGYVKAVRRHLDLKARLAVHDERLRPLRNKVAVASENVKRRYGRLNGGQIAAAERLLREDSTPVKEMA
jgi:hypothetical protein